MSSVSEFPIVDKCVDIKVLDSHYGSRYLLIRVANASDVIHVSFASVHTPYDNDISFSNDKDDNNNNDFIFFSQLRYREKYLRRYGLHRPELINSKFKIYGFILVKYL